MLVSRDETSCLVVSYKEIKACMEGAFTYVSFFFLGESFGLFNSLGLVILRDRVRRLRLIFNLLDDVVVFCKVKVNLEFLSRLAVFYLVPM